MSFERVNEEILDKLDIRAEYESLGVTGFGARENSKGWLACCAFGHDQQKTPSAGVNVGRGSSRGFYHDFKHGVHQHLFEFAHATAGKFKDWSEARRHYAGKVGVSLSRGRMRTRAEDKFEWMPWVENLARVYCSRKPGISVDGLRRCGAQMGRWPKGSPQPEAVFAVPIYGPRLTESEPVGYIAFSRTGGELSVFKGKGVPVERSKTVTPRLEGTVAVWAGVDCHNLDEAELVWKVEGVTDMLSLMSIMPEEYFSRHVVVTSANGCGEIPKPDHLQSVEGKRVVLIHDADKPGEDGAAVWLASLARVCDVSQFRLPYPVVEKHGKDLRDWINEGHTYSELLGLIGGLEVFGPGSGASTPPDPTPEQQAAVEAANLPPAPPPATARQSVSKETALLTYYQSLLDAIGIEVVGECDGSGNDSPVVVHSHILQKTSVLDRVDYPRVIQAAGVTALANIREPGTRAEENDTRVPFSEIRNAILVLASGRRMRNMSQIGAGLFRGRDQHGIPTDKLLFVNRDAAYSMNGALKIDRVESLRSDGRVIEFGTTHDNWFDPDTLDAAIRNCADIEWQRERLATLEGIFRKWNWTRGYSDATLLSGLVLATWAQSILPWRPWVCISGASNTGKTTLMKFLEHLFGSEICFSSSDTSDAGIAQAVRNKSLVLLLDEFELSQYRSKIYSLFRGSSRGSSRDRGSSKGIASSHTLFHLPWMAAIEMGLFREADQNRAIKFELTAIDTTVDFTLPNIEETRQLGVDMLAIAATNVLRAIDRYEMIRRESAGNGLPQRLVESMGIAVVMLAEVMRATDEQSIDLLRVFLGSVDAEDYSANESDELLSDIIGAQVDLGRGERRTVAEILCEPAGSIKSDAEEAMERAGVSCVKHDGTTYLFIAAKVQKTLLRFTRWDQDGFDIKQMLRRLSGARQTQCRVADQRARGVSVPWRVVERHLDVRSESGY